MKNPLLTFSLIRKTTTTNLLFILSLFLVSTPSILDAKHNPNTPTYDNCLSATFYLQGGDPQTTILNGDITPSATDGTNFGDVHTYSYDEHTFTLYNDGTTDINISNISLDNTIDFTLSALSTNPIIANGGSSTFSITANPQTLGIKTATITIDNDDLIENPYTFTISTNGTLPAGYTIVNNSYCEEFNGFSPVSNPYCGDATNITGDFWYTDDDNTSDWKSASSALFATNYSNAFAHITNFFNNCAANTDNYLYSPVFNINGLSDAFLNFRYYKTSINSDFTVETSIDGVNWNVLTTPGDTYQWKLEQVSLAPFITAPALQFRFKANLDMNSSSTVSLDQVCVTNCPFSSSITTQNTTSTSTDITWTDLASSSPWSVEIVPSGNAYTGTGISSSNTSLTVNTLTPETKYDVYIFNNCNSVPSEKYTFKTPCAAISASGYCQDFETMNISGSNPCGSTDALMDCWFNELSNENTWIVKSGSTSTSGTGPNAAHSGNNYIYTANTCGHSSAYSPLLDFTSTTTPVLEFYYHMLGSSVGTIRVEASTDNGSDWTTIWQINGNQGGSWNKASVDMSNYTSSNNVWLKFDYLNSGGGSKGDVALDDLCILDMPACFSPSNISITNNTNNSADLSWDLGNATEYHIQLSVTGNPNSSLSFTSTTSPITLTGLEEGTNYNLTITGNCGALGNSTTISSSFFTTCSVPAFPLCIGFENMNTGTGICGTENPFYLGNCMNNKTTNTNNWQVLSGPPSSSGTGPSSAFLSDNYLYLEASGGCHSTESILELNAFDLSGLSGSLILDFNYHMSGANMGSLEVEISTDGGNTWNTEFNISGNQGWLWQNAELDLSAYLGFPNVHLQFVGTTGLNFQSDIAIDEICFTQCKLPTDISIGGKTTTSIDVNWLPGDTETSWNVEVVPVGITPTGIGTAYNTNSITINGLTPGTNYEIYIQADCGNSTSPFTNVKFVKTNPICGDVLKDYGEDEFYPNNETDEFTICPDSPSEYITLSIYEVDLGIGENMSVYTGTDTSIPHTTNITEPTNITAHNAGDCFTYLFTSNATNSYNNPKNGQGYELEINCNPCIPVGDIYVSTVTTSSAQIEWTQNGTETAWQIEVIPIGTMPTGTGVSANTNPFMITGLNSGTFYDVYVYADCGGTTSVSPLVETFGTTPSCGDIIYDSGGPSGSYLDANGGVETSTYTVCPQNAGDYVTFSIMEMNIGNDVFEIYDGNNTSGTLLTTSTIAAPVSYTSTDASGCLTYQFLNYPNTENDGYQILTSCSGCRPPSGVTIGNTTIFSADFSWTANGNETSWDVEVVPVGQLPTGATSVNTSSTSVHITNLTGGIIYDVFIAPNCGGIGSGDYTFATQLELPCLLSKDLDHCQGFENMTLGSGTCGDVDRLSECWQNDIANDENWQVSNGTNISVANNTQNYLSDGASVGNQFIYLGGLNNTVNCATSTGTVYSPVYNISPSAYPSSLSFDFRMQGQSPSLNIEVSLEGGAWTTIYSITGNQGATWHSHSIDLSSYIGNTSLQFRFHGIAFFVNDNNYNYMGVVALDEICVTEEACVGSVSPEICTSFSETVLPGGGWTDINGDNGQPIVSINAPVGVDLGTVTVEVMKHNTIRTHGTEFGTDIKLLPRVFHLSSSNYASDATFPSDVEVRFYFTKEELSMMNEANIGENGITNILGSDIDITHYNGSFEDCDPSNNNTLISDTNELISNPIYSSLFCMDHRLQVSVNHFSEFIPHEPNGSSLPVELNSFEARKVGEYAALHWSTSSETNNKGFYIERSSDGVNYESIGWIDGQGTTSEIQEYEFTDHQPHQGVNYYRLLQVDYDESSEWSEVRTVMFDTKFHINMFPNPTQKGKTTNIQIFTDATEEIQIQITDLSGKIVWVNEFLLENGSNHLVLPQSDLLVGIYLVTIQHGQKTEHLKLSIID